MNRRFILSALMAASAVLPLRVVEQDQPAPSTTTEPQTQTQAAPVAVQAENPVDCPTQFPEALVSFQREHPELVGDYRSHAFRIASDLPCKSSAFAIHAEPLPNQYTGVLDEFFERHGAAVTNALYQEGLFALGRKIDPSVALIRLTEKRPNVLIQQLLDKAAVITSSQNVYIPTSAQLRAAFGNFSGSHAIYVQSGGNSADVDICEDTAPTPYMAHQQQQPVDPGALYDLTVRVNATTPTKSDGKIDGYVVAGYNTCSGPSFADVSLYTVGFGYKFYLEPQEGLAALEPYKTRMVARWASKDLANRIVDLSVGDYFNFVAADDMDPRRSLDTFLPLLQKDCTI